MNVSYFRDTRHNYLVMKVDEEALSKYQYKMANKNEIDGMAHFDLRNMDGDSFLYYEIDSRQSMESKYADRKMNKQELSRFLRGYIKICENLEKYLLDDSCILLRADCIFEEFSSGKFFFLYNPRCDTSSSFFINNLVNYVDMSDREASALVYKICDGLMDNSCGSALLIADILKSEDATEEMAEKVITFGRPEELIMQDKADFMDDEDEEEEVENKVIRIRVPFRLSYIMGGLFLIVAAALFYLRVVYNLTYEENLLDLGTLMASVMMSLICFIQGIKKKKDSSIPSDDFDDDEDR